MTTNEDLLQKTFEILKKANSKIEQLESERSEPIAIIGMACRFPGGANTLEDFWRILERGGDVITEIPKDRWNVEDYYDPDPQAIGKMNTRYGGFINIPLAQFDADFFCKYNNII